MTNGDNNKNTNQAWSQTFAENALERATEELEFFQLIGNHTPLARQRRMAEAAQAIGFMMIHEAGGLLAKKTVQRSRDNILAGLAEIIQNGYPYGTHLGHDLVDAIAEAVGEYASREDSDYS